MPGPLTQSGNLFPNLSLHLRCYWVHALPRKATERTDTQHGTETTGATATRRGRHDLALHQESIIAILKSEKFNKLKKKEQTQKTSKKLLLGHWQTQRIGKNASQNRILGINWQQITTRKNFHTDKDIAKHATQKSHLRYSLATKQRHVYQFHTDKVLFTGQH